MPALSVDHVTSFFVAFAGATVAVSVVVSPSSSVAVVLLSVTPVTATVSGAFSVTVTAHVAVLPPSTVVTVMVAVPAATAVTTPNQPLISNTSGFCAACL